MPRLQQRAWWARPRIKSVLWRSQTETLRCGPGAYEAAMRTLLQEWDWDAILPCHGGLVQSGGKALLRKHLGRS